MSAQNLSGVSYETDGRTAIVTIERPERRNAVDGETARALYAAFKQFDADDGLDVAVLTGRGGYFCAGADLKAISTNRPDSGANPIKPDGDLGPMGVTRLRLGKPVIAAVEGPAVAGGLEVACWADMRVAAEGATFGVFCRRFGVPLIDLGTVRLPRLIGHSRAMDMILTGRPVDAQEALAIGLANRVVPKGEGRRAAEALAAELAALPQLCLRSDRLSMMGQWGMSEAEAIDAEFASLQRVAAESLAGAKRFAEGAGRHGASE
jgi:enoyl-CoA hydratase